MGDPTRVWESDYLEQVYHRSSTLFEEVFASDPMYFIVCSHVENRSKKLTRIFQRYLKDKSMKYNLILRKLPLLYEEEEASWETRQFILNAK